MTKFLIRNHPNDRFHDVSQYRYKTIAKESSERGLPLRTEVMYVDGQPVKKLTPLEQT